MHSYADYNRDATKATTRAHIRRLKPDLADRFEEGWAFLKEHELLPGRP